MLSYFSFHSGFFKNAECLTSFVAFLGVAVTGLDRSAFAVTVDAVAGASALLDASTTRHRTLGPCRPGGPPTMSRNHCCFGGKHMRNEEL